MALSRHPPGLSAFTPGLRSALHLFFVVSCLDVACGGATDPRPASWSYLSAAIMQPNCATVSCHGPAAAIAGLDFSTQDRGYTSLMGLWIWIVDPNGDLNSGCKPVESTIVCPRQHRSLVIPFDPAQSRLVHMLRAQGAPRMPPDRPLPEADIRLIENWILSGAPRGISGIPTVVAPVDGGAGAVGDSRSSDGGAAEAPAADAPPTDAPTDTPPTDAPRPDAGPTT
jgi:hypothetical protein